MKVSYAHYLEFPGWGGAPGFLSALVAREGSASVLEIGSGANPTLSPAQVRELGVRYTTNDRSAGELAKADPAYETLLLDVAAPSSFAGLPHEAFDLVFSRMVNEHVADGERYHRDIFATLRPGGVAAHCFSTLYALPFVVNRVVPEGLAGRLLDVFNPREDPYMHDKFPARYSWSRGPTRRAIGRLTRLGYEVVEYRGYFGHPYYDRPALRPVRALEQAKADWLCRHPVPALTSYAVVVLRKPRSDDGPGPPARAPSPE
jgi:SAM-dependent methyltransferase